MDDSVNEIRRVAVLGAGAMGAAYAAKFFDVPRFSTVLVARDPRFERLRTQGLVVNGKQFTIPVVHPDESTEPADLIIVAPKNHHIEEATHDVRNLVGSGTTIISVMNGLESEDRLDAVYGMNKVLYSIAVGIDAVRDENSVTYTNPGKIFFGERDN